MNTNVPQATACPVHALNTTVGTAPNGCPVSAGAAAFDPFSAGYMKDPSEYVRWAREREPVFFNPKLGMWVVTRYEDIKAILRDHGSFSPANVLEPVTPPSAGTKKILQSYGYALNRTLVNEDEPIHMERRRLLLQPFTPEALKPLEPLVRDLTRQYVDRFVNDGHADLVDQMLWEVPLTIALHFLGVDEEDMARLHEYSAAHTANLGARLDDEAQAKVAHTVGAFWRLCGEIIEKMRRDPSGPGWMRYVVRTHAEHPDIVTENFVQSMMMAGIVAAHETTTSATTNALRLLLQHPTAWGEICDDPGLIPNAVEECLRFTGAIIAWRRVALRDVTVGGSSIAAGSKFLMLLMSGNHDESRFPDADLLDIRRDDAVEHLSFGYGAHQCLGKNLARMEMQIFLQELSRRLPHMKLSEQEFQYRPVLAVRRSDRLLVQWDPLLNPELRDPSILRRHHAVRIGESTSAAASLPVRVDAVRPVARWVLELRLVPSAGQELKAWTPGAHIDLDCGTTGLSRQYSLCGDPNDRTSYTIAVLRDPDSRGGSAWIHEALRAGDMARIRGPRNHFRFDENAGRVVFIAGGIGITPISAMARRARQLGIDYELHYCGSSRDAMAYMAELAGEHADRLHLHVSSEGTRADFAALLADPRVETRVYACGPDRAYFSDRGRLFQSDRGR